MVPCEGFGVRHRIGNVNIGGGDPCGGGATGGLGTAMGDANIMKGWGVLRQTLDMLILLGVGGLRQRLGKFNIQGVGATVWGFEDRYRGC